MKPHQSSSKLYHTPSENAKHLPSYTSCLSAQSRHCRKNISQEHQTLQSSEKSRKIKPNTTNLRDLQKPELLEKILKNVKSINGSLKSPVPIFIKIAPDLYKNNIIEILNVCEENGVSGLIATNTTISSKTLKKPTSFEGGLSGKPLFKPSNNILRLLAKKKNASTALIGVGGIFSATDIYEKIKLGASAVQIYTGFVYNGPTHIKKMEMELKNLLLSDGYKSIDGAVGALIR